MTTSSYETRVVRAGDTPGYHAEYRLHADGACGDWVKVPYCAGGEPIVFVTCGAADETAFLMARRSTPNDEATDEPRPSPSTPNDE